MIGHVSIREWIWWVGCTVHSGFLVSVVEIIVSEGNASAPLWEAEVVLVTDCIALASVDSSTCMWLGMATAGKWHWYGVAWQKATLWPVLS